MTEVQSQELNGTDKLQSKIHILYRKDNALFSKEEILVYKPQNDSYYVFLNCLVYICIFKYILICKRLSACVYNDVRMVNGVLW